MNRSATLLLSLLPVLSAAVSPADAGDDQYRFLAGLAEKGLHAMVVREAEAFLRDHPEHARRDHARYRLADARFELGESAQALPHLRALAALPRFELAAEVLFRLGQCELAAGDHAAARAAFDRVVALRKDYLVEHARLLSADAAFQAADFAAAERGYAAVLREHPAGVTARDASSGHAWCAWKLGDAAEAERRIEAHLARFAGGDDPYAGELRVLLGEARLAAGDAAGALAAYRAVDDPAQADAALRGAAHARAELGDHAGAAADFGELFERSPDGPFAAEATLFRGVALVQSGDAHGALAALSQRAAGDSAEVLYWRGRAQSDAGDGEAALGTLGGLARALRDAPDPELAARGELLRGDVLTALGRGDEAVAAYRAAGSDYALHAAAVAALNGGDPREAARIGAELLDAFPRSEYVEHTRVVVGEAWFRSGDHARAADALAGLDRSAGDPELRARAASRLAWCAYLRGDDATDAFARVASEHADAPEAEEAAYMEGRAREEAGDAAGAVRAWRAYLAAHRDGASRAAVLAGLARTDALAAAMQAVETLARETPRSEHLPRALYDVAERASAAGELETAAACYARLCAGAPAKRPPGPSEVSELPGLTGLPGANELRGPAHYGLGWCHLQAGRFEAAGAELAAAVADPDAPAELRAAAAELAVWAWRQAGDGTRAAEAWRELARWCDDEARVFEAARTAALALQEAGDAPAAQDLLGAALRHTRTPAVAARALVEGAYLALDAGDVDRAEAQVAVARKRDAGDPTIAAKLAEAAFFVGEARFAAGEAERARALYRAASAAGSPVRDLALYKLAYLELAADGDAAAAESALALLAAEHPESELLGEALFLLGEARFRRGDFAAAAADLERVRRDHPEHAVIPKALFRLGLSYAELERWNDCEAAIRALLQREPHFENLAEAELARGRALVALGRERGARQALARVLELSGDTVLGARAHLALGRLAEARRDSEGALAEYLKVAVLYAPGAEVAEALVRAGDVLAGQGKLDAARDRWREAAEHADTEHGALAARRLTEVARGDR